MPDQLTIINLWDCERIYLHVSEQRLWIVTLWVTYLEDTKKSDVCVFTDEFLECIYLPNWCVCMYFVSWFFHLSSFLHFPKFPLSARRSWLDSVSSIDRINLLITRHKFEYIPDSMYEPSRYDFGRGALRCQSVWTRLAVRCLVNVLHTYGVVSSRLRYVVFCPFVLLSRIWSEPSLLTKNCLKL